MSTRVWYLTGIDTSPVGRHPRDDNSLPRLPPCGVMPQFATVSRVCNRAPRCPTGRPADRGAAGREELRSVTAGGDRSRSGRRSPCLTPALERASKPRFYGTPREGHRRRAIGICWLSPTVVAGRGRQHPATTYARSWRPSSAATARHRGWSPLPHRRPATDRDWCRRRGPEPHARTRTPGLRPHLVINSPGHAVRSAMASMQQRPRRPYCRQRPVGGSDGQDAGQPNRDAAKSPGVPTDGTGLEPAARHG